MLSFLQQGLEQSLCPSTLKVYMAAIAVHHDPIEEKFLRGARRLNPPRLLSVPSWDLSLVLKALRQALFEPLQSVELKFLLMKTLLLLALASIKRRPGGEPASAAPRGGRPRPSFALSRLSPKMRMAHWIVDAITLAYQAQGVPCLLRLQAHSTRSVASSLALVRGTSLTDICRGAGWATPNTFSRFYSLRVEPVSSCVLTSNG
ncbi:tRNA N6-adenosine threonylcarbamoyltransferase [Labeo rohita]|uniref:tRNA N6-adenosine threonylcarbamoyltransferase n=1 Tax=Labeo rohita TaxID=84645 RepID=A0ABQ8L6B2_LABRO|nr:tRNA N6-adenosine threonylcarbamoyltransferase [Labeo rohita]